MKSVLLFHKECNNEEYMARLDMGKAYIILNWDIIGKCLADLGFYDR